MGGGAEAKPAKPIKRYPYAFADDGDLVWYGASLSEKQGEMLVISGSFAGHIVSNYAENLMSLLEDGWKPTRIDVAWDLKEGGGNASETLELLDYHYRDNLPRTYNPIWRNGRLETIYVGSRQSSSMLRAYNKAAERNIDGYWLRLEMEFKDSLAYQALAFALAGNYAPCLNKLIDKLPCTGDMTASIVTYLKDATSGEGRLIGSRKDTDPTWWMYQQVRPALLKWAKSDYLTFRAYVRLIAKEALDGLPVQDYDIE
jgi:hypothetical protein